MKGYINDNFLTRLQEREAKQEIIARAEWDACHCLPDTDPLNDGFARNKDRNVVYFIGEDNGNISLIMLHPTEKLWHLYVVAVTMDCAGEPTYVTPVIFERHPTMREAMRHMIDVVLVDNDQE